MSAPTKVPYRKYLQILILTNNSDDDIRQGFSRRRLFQPSKELLQDVKKELWAKFDQDLKTFYADTVGPLETIDLPKKAVALMAQLGIDEVINNKDGFNAAKSIFDQIDLRLCAYAHMLHREDENILKESLETMTKESVHEEALSLFKKFFCSTTQMDYSAWKEWIWQLREINFFEADVYASCFNTRYPFDLIKWKIHAKLGTQDLDELLKNLTVYTYYKTIEAIEASDDADYERVHSWIEKFLKAYEKHKTFGKGKLGNDALAPVEDALFQLKRVRLQGKNVKELGENVTQVAAPTIITITPPKKSSVE